MFDYVTHAIVRILDAQQRPVGAGCLVRERLIVTCAHVVAEALDISRDAAEAPAVPVALDLPFVPDSLAKARVILWWPYRQAVAEDRLHDLAFLELEHPLYASEPARLLRPGHERSAPIQVYGFPRGAGLGSIGDWIEGRVTPPLPNGWLKLVQRDQQARFIEPGCSGGPVIVDDTGLVAGIVSLRRSGPGLPEAYGISAAVIREALGSVAAAGAGVGALQQEPVEEARPEPPEPAGDAAPAEPAPAGKVAFGAAAERRAQVRIFLAHASEDKPQVRQLYDALKAQGFAPWLDEVDLIPGQVWREEIPKAIRRADLFLACLSSRSAGKQGYVQSEFRTALTTFGERPPGSIWLIPVKLDDCEIPDLQIPDRGISLRDIQWLDLSRQTAFEQLVKAIELALPKPASAFLHNDPAAAGATPDPFFYADDQGKRAGVIDISRLPDEFEEILLQHARRRPARRSTTALPQEIMTRIFSVVTGYVFLFLLFAPLIEASLPNAIRDGWPSRPMYVLSWLRSVFFMYGAATWTAISVRSYYHQRNKWLFCSDMKCHRVLHNYLLASWLAFVAAFLTEFCFQLVFGQFHVDEQFYAMTAATLSATVSGSFACYWLDREYTAVRFLNSANLVVLQGIITGCLSLFGSIVSNAVFWGYLPGAILFSAVLATTSGLCIGWCMSFYMDERKRERDIVAE
jgi:hypothetical protein